MPLRHVHQVMVPDPTRRVGHASKAEIGAIGQDRCQQRRCVIGGVAGTQVSEAAGKSGPTIDVTQDLVDPCPRQHPIQPNSKLARSVRNGRLIPRLGDHDR
jgi:hypothetical protein